MILEPLRLMVTVDLGPDASAEELDESARRLRSELAEAGLDEVEMAHAGSAPDGTKSAEALILGGLLLTVLPSALAGLMAVSQDWASRRPGRTLTFSYGAGAQRLEFQYDPDKMDINQLVTQLVQVQAARQIELGAGSSVGGDLVGGDKVSNTNVGGDSVGHDKITHVHAAPGATIIINEPLPAIRPTPEPPASE